MASDRPNVDSSKPLTTPPAPGPPHDESTQARPDTATAPRPDTVTSDQSEIGPGSYISSVASYFSYPARHVVSGLYRRFTDPGQLTNDNSSTTAAAGETRASGKQPSQQGHRSRHSRSENDGDEDNGNGNGAMPLSSKFGSRFSSSRSRSGAGTGTASSSGSYTPPPRPRDASPFNPPPLTPLTLKASGNISSADLVLTKALAEEIRLLVPPRLQLLDTWELGYSLERDGSSLATLYARCRDIAARHPRAGYVLVVKDTSETGNESASSVATGKSNGSLFGAYLTDPPRPSSHFYGTGECFLWKASTIPFAGSVTASPMLKAIANPGSDADSREASQTRVEALREAHLPPPPSADTTDMARSTSIINCMLVITPHRLGIKFILTYRL